MCPGVGIQDPSGVWTLTRSVRSVLYYRGSSITSLRTIALERGGSVTSTRNLTCVRGFVYALKKYDLWNMINSNSQGKHSGD